MDKFISKADMAIQTNWCIITGPPSSGKTTLINALSVQGYQTAPEIARAYLTYLLSAGEIRQFHNRGEAALQDKIFSLKLEREQQLPVNDLIFFDRGLPDSLGYYRYYHLNTDKILKKMRHYRYKHVFFLEGLPVIYDNIRYEDEVTAKQLGQYIYDAYLELGYEAVKISPVSVEKRIEMILKIVRDHANNQGSI